jgi:hypothetical protein
VGGVARGVVGRANFLNRHGFCYSPALLGLGFFHPSKFAVPIRLDLSCGGLVISGARALWAQAEARLLFTQSSRLLDSLRRECISLS